jgi:large subunit ribosomal protein L10
MDRNEKADLVAELKQVFTETSVVVVTRNLGLTVAQSTDLRLRMRDAGAQFKVAKNRLALIALDGTRYQPIGELLKGPTALATSIDPVAAAKVAVDFAKTTDKFEVLGGAMGDTVLDLAGVTALAELPSLDQLRATLSGWCRLRRPRLPGPSPSRVRCWRGCSVLMRPRKQHSKRLKVLRSFTHDNRGRRAPHRSRKWLTSTTSSTSCRRSPFSKPPSSPRRSKRSGAFRPPLPSPSPARPPLPLRPLKRRPSST